MRNWLQRFFSGNYNILLILLFLLFIFRPYDYHEIYIGVWKTLLTLSLIIAIFNCNHTRATKCTISILAVPTIILSWINLYETYRSVFIAVAVLTAVFMIICVSSIVYDVLLRARVTLETLRGVICAYFLVAFIFAYVYLLLEYVAPGTMTIRDQVHDIFPHTHYFSDMLYFSFVTLLTIGFGDIVAVKEWGQTAVVMEGIIGQFYIAILVARIVSVYSFLSDKRLLKELEKDLHVK